MIVKEDCNELFFYSSFAEKPYRLTHQEADYYPHYIEIDILDQLGRIGLRQSPKGTRLGSLQLHDHGTIPLDDPNHSLPLTDQWEKDRLRIIDLSN